MPGQGINSLIPPYQNKFGTGQAPKQSDTEQPVVSENRNTETKKTSYEKPRYGMVAKLKPNNVSAVFQLEVGQIKPNPYQPRKEFNEEELRELASSIREFGIIQPIIVSKLETEVPTGTAIEYQLIAGERRLMAAKLIGLPRVPAIVRSVDSNKTKLELALIENIQRSDLNPLETARAYARLQDEFEFTQREIAVRVGKSREVVANTLRLLSLPSYAQEALSGGKINESQARALLAISNIEEQKAVLAKVMNEKLSVRAIKENVNDISESQKTPEAIYWEKQLEEKLGAPVKLVKDGGRGKMIVRFYSEEEWQGIVQKLLGSISE